MSQRIQWDFPSVYMNLSYVINTLKHTRNTKNSFSYINFMIVRENLIDPKAMGRMKKWKIPENLENVSFLSILHHVLYPQRTNCILRVSKISFLLAQRTFRKQAEIKVDGNENEIHKKNEMNEGEWNCHKN